MDLYAGFLEKRLKSLRPVKQEWSKEDETAFDNALSGLKYAYEDLINHKSFDSAEDVKNAFDWLNSFRSRPKSSDNWKPSDEQMKALEECGECKRCIKELYDGLAKLQ